MKMRLSIHSIRVKFVLIFMGIFLIASLLSFYIMIHFAFGVILTSLKPQMIQTSSAILELDQKTDLSVEEIARLQSNSMYEIMVYRDMKELPYRLKTSQIEALLKGEKVFIKGSVRNLFPAVLIQGDGYYIEVRLHSRLGNVTIFRYTVIVALIICTSIGGLLVLFAVRQITKPVKRLTKAAQEVAKGNFDVQVDYDSADEIGVLTRNFNRMVRELRNMEHLRKDFLSNVSHEFKTPIASIQGFANLLKDSTLPPERFDEYTDIIISESDRLSKLTSNVLKLSRLENQDIVSVKQEFSVDEQIRRVLLLLEQKWTEKELELDLRLEPVRWVGNEEMLEQVWINLIGNAIKFSDPGGYLKIQLYRKNFIVVAEIEDHGIGMDAEVQERIFDKFYQGDSSHSKEGSGLGLAIVKRILELCKGEIACKSEPGVGTRFTIWLPDIGASHDD
ncbi:sensor histidine kinase [Bianquea renquensis]|jgi:integral membrane sensor signal transduction histidine kinase|uniref:Heme sensor protein HssS n=1 Tax=Bianquea renquensis TaxID=2763661 RepID=A0A926DU59_9FIRM|nr:HAMP domain-containing sensor histidine kinase [Bianquea renquensis]MBC8544003.1 HAMP domain-containing histidine kinase [Bianquea renquensis]